jgi:hypothetical protein
MGALGQAALELASLGLHIFPCRPGEKEPAIYNGFKRATVDLNTITGWWRGEPDYNIGIRAGELSDIWGLRYLWGGDFAVIAGATREGKQTPLLAVAIILTLIGVFAFFAVLLRLI